MAYRPHTYVTLSGALPETDATNDIWQIGVRGLNPISGGDTPIDQGQLANYLAAIEADVTTWFTSAGADIPGTVTLRQLKAANVGADGHYTGEAVTRALNVQGSVGTQALPAFCSVAYTFETDMGGRRAKFGRVYPPNLGYGLVAGSVISADMADQAARSAVQFLNALNNQGDQFRFEAAVVSKLGPFAYIRHASVDRIIDVQRRRKNAISSYGRVTYPVTGS